MTVHDDALRDKRGRSFLKVYTSEYDHFAAIPRGVRAYAMAVYMCLASHAHGDKDVAWPAHATICDATGLVRNTVKKAIAALVESGHISIQERYHGEGRSSNLYTLLAVVAKQVEPQDVVGHVVTQVGHVATHPGHVATHPGHVVTQVGHVVTQVGHVVTTNQIKEPDQRTRSKEEEGMAPLSLARHSPKGGTSLSPEIERIRQWSERHPLRRMR